MLCGFGDPDMMLNKNVLCSDPQAGYENTTIPTLISSITTVLLTET